MPEVAVTTAIQEESLVIAMSGELDIATAPGCAGKLDGVAVEVTPAFGLVVLDMRRVEFCGSAGSRVLTTFADTCTDRGLRVCVLAQRRGVVRRILEVTHLDAVLPTFDDLGQAVGHHQESRLTHS